MEYGANQSVTNVYEYGEQKNSATINGMKAYYMYDGRGSVSNLTGKNGNTVASYSYDAFGNTTASNPVINNPYQYNAEYTDSSTGLQYLRARYYNSGTGSFITEDTELGSIEKPITRNLYIYCGNNPLNYTDPSGHNWFKNAVNSVKRTASNVVNTVKSGYNTAKNWANTHIVQPVKSFVSNTKTAVTNAYSKGKTYVTQKCNQVKQSYNNTKTWASNKWNNFKTDVSAKTQKAIEEAKRFACTTKDRIKTSWKNDVVGVAGGFIRESLLGIVTDEVSENLAKTGTNYLYNKIPTAFMNKGLAAATIDNGIKVLPEFHSIPSTLARNVVKNGVPIVSTVIDFGLQISSGENVVDSGVKAVSHTAIGIGAAKAGAAIGTAIGGPVGTAIGAGLGFVGGVAGSMIFDSVYDKLRGK